MIRSALLIGSVILGTACTAQQWGFPRTPVFARSPDGRYAAFVRNHPNLDPTDQSLWIQATGGTAERVMQVPPDAFWCDTILWSADSRRVAFIVANAIVHVFDPASRRLVFSGFVGRRSWDTPPRYILSGAALMGDGSGMVFRECERDYVPGAPGQNTRGSRVAVSLRACTTQPQMLQFDEIPQDRWLAR
jgi:hypothetical protein